MKKLTILSAITLATAMSVNPANAEPTTDRNPAIGAAKFTAGAIAGGLVGGPIGAVLGALGGGLFAEHDFALSESQQELETVQVELSQLEQETLMQQAKIAELEDETLARMELQVMFDTGADQLSKFDHQHLKTLATYLERKPELAVQLDGHADPRGTDEYNNVLSKERALAVRNRLIDEGIAADRVQIFSHGSTLSTALSGDTEAYAQERRVDIQLTVPKQKMVTQADW